MLLREGECLFNLERFDDSRYAFTVLLQRGAFDVSMVEATARALFYYSLALLPVAWVRVLAPAFYALQDTRTPVKAAFWSLWVNVASASSQI